MAQKRVFISNDNQKHLKLASVIAKIKSDCIQPILKRFTFDRIVHQESKEARPEAVVCAWFHALRHFLYFPRVLFCLVLNGAAFHCCCGQLCSYCIPECDFFAKWHNVQ